MIRCYIPPKMLLFLIIITIIGGCQVLSVIIAQSNRVRLYSTSLSLSTYCCNWGKNWLSVRNSGSTTTLHLLIVRENCLRSNCYCCTSNCSDDCVWMWLSSSWNINCCYCTNKFSVWVQLFERRGTVSVRSQLQELLWRYGGLRGWGTHSEPISSS